ncbi:hypothetical protein RN001_009414 [Aquatica leii]|uniref:Sodium-coupled monocarboxylate transporter 1 n=1 Tax=Aquatica leii TaxID=1421715 RepID=A0AAN7P6M4_9COLE|nr:hypothetical protein RN001_009414 [Aquatica leii]
MCHSDNLDIEARSASQSSSECSNMSAKILFTWMDHTLFFFMLSCSTLIGIYFACKKNKTKDEYLFGGKTMSIFPVATSLVASNISGIILMAVPADVYQYGASFIWSPIAITITVVSFLYIYMPVLLKFEYNTIFEYLEVRFNRRLRLLASAFFILQMLLNNPILIFIPTLAFAQVSGFPIHAISIIVCTVCIFYTTIGGLKAVVWTDTLQTVSMYLSLITVFGMGVFAVGGFTNLWNTALQGERLDVLRFNIDMTDRNSFWSMVIGFTVVCINNIATHQATIQRLIAVPTYSDATKVLWLFLIGIIVANTFATLTGILVYARYAGCDPVTTKEVLRYDQILPYFVLDVAGKIIGLPGLFIAGVFSAALSSLSTNLNTLAGVIYSDFLLLHLSKEFKEKHKNVILKVIVVVTGTICIGSVFVVEQLGGIIPLATCFLAITGGPLLGLFTLGITVPKAHSKGALIGGVTGVVFVSWMVIGNQYYQHLGVIQDVPKPASTENCTFSTYNKTIVDEETSEFTEIPFILYRINFWYYAPLGCLSTMVVGYLGSLITSSDAKRIKPELIAPWFRFLLVQKTSTIEESIDPLQIPLNTLK